MGGWKRCVDSESVHWQCPRVPRCDSGESVCDEELADAMYLATQMTAEDQSRRMQRMREHVQRHNVYRWGGKILSELLKFDFPENV